jgi:putative phosphoesterase
MKVGVLSDTHDQLTRTIRAVAILEAAGAEALVHCGDLTSPEIVHACSVLPAWYVLGNNDYDERGLRAAIEGSGGVCLGFGGEIALGGRRLGVTHGDRPSEFRRLLKEMPDYLLSGHTHVPLWEPDEPTRQLNPGALHRAASWTVALLDLGNDRVDFLKLG